MKTRVVFCTALAAATLTGCATSSLIDDTPRYSTVKTVLVEDSVVAFGRPADNAAVNAQLVIVGEQHNYALTSGGAQLAKLLTTLDAKNISVNNELKFYSANNDGNFAGEIQLSYAKLKDEFSRSDLQFFLQNDGKECSSSSDEKIGAQRFCFNINIKGAVYPQASNYQLLRSQYAALSRPYSVSIYTESQRKNSGSKSVAEKIVLLPFALAFDVVTLPLQILGK